MTENEKHDMVPKLKELKVGCQRNLITKTKNGEGQKSVAFLLYFILKSLKEIFSPVSLPVDHHLV